MNDLALLRSTRPLRAPAHPGAARLEHRGTNRCFVRPRPHDSPSLRLIVFHHAGGAAAMYHTLAAELPPDWELLVLELPGRGKRHAEDLVTTLPALVARVAEDVVPWLGVPVALFGHSLGAILAAEVARVCEQRGVPPVWVGVSGRVAPVLQSQARRLSTLDDATLLAEVLALGGTPARICELVEVRERFLRVVRADIAVLESYQPVPDRRPLGCPVTAFAGISDAYAPPATMQRWDGETAREFRLRLFPGGHFYFLGPAFAELGRAVVREIEPHIPAGAQWSEISGVYEPPAVAQDRAAHRLTTAPGRL
jgi:surfactin synthase thioesterase subunit